MTTAFQRVVRDYVRESYPGVTGLRIEGGGKHSYLSFTYLSVKRRITLASSPSDRNALIVKIGDIKRELGPPPEPVKRRRRNLEEMTHTMNETAARLAPADAARFGTPSVSALTSNWSVEGEGKVRLTVHHKMLTVLVPEDVFRAFDRVSDTGESGAGSKTIAVSLLGTDPPRFEVAYDPTRKARFVQAGKFWMTQVGAGEMTRLGDFSTTPAKAIYANGKITVVLTEPSRRPTAEATRSPSATAASLDTLAPDALVDARVAAKFLGLSEQTLQRFRSKGGGPTFVKRGPREVWYRVDALHAYKAGRTPPTAPAATVPVPSPASSGIPSADDMTAALTTIARVERLTVYRLTRMNDGAWAFRAPTIRLPEQKE